MFFVDWTVVLAANPILLVVSHQNLSIRQETSLKVTVYYTTILLVLLLLLLIKGDRPSLLCGRKMDCVAGYFRLLLCTCSPYGIMFFYLVTWGWNFTSAYYVRIQSINIRRHMERRHVNREEFRE